MEDIINAVEYIIEKGGFSEVNVEEYNWPVILFKLKERLCLL